VGKNCIEKRREEIEERKKKREKRIFMVHLFPLSSLL